MDWQQWPTTLWQHDDVVSGERIVMVDGVAVSGVDGVREDNPHRSAPGRRFRSSWVGTCIVSLKRHNLYSWTWGPEMAREAVRHELVTS